MKKDNYLSPKLICVDITPIVSICAVSNLKNPGGEGTTVVGGNVPARKLYI